MVNLVPHRISAEKLPRRRHTSPFPMHPSLPPSVLLTLLFSVGHVYQAALCRKLLNWSNFKKLQNKLPGEEKTTTKKKTICYFFWSFCVCLLQYLGINKMMIHLMHPQTAARQQRHCTGLSEGSFSHTANSLRAAATSQATQGAAFCGYTH